MRSTGLACILLSCAAVAGAQTPPAVKAEAVPKPPDAAAASTAPDVTFSYDPAGRRDPFVSLIGGNFESSGGKRPDGSTGLSVTEISVRGIMQSHGALVAMVQGPDNKTYVMHAGDKLIDGTIKAITPQGLVIVQEVNDPLSLVKQREIRKLLRSFEDGKQ
jgi:Tfp pilus assembly protein PilP